MHEARALAVRPGRAQHFQHAVDVARGARAALHRKPHWLVEHQYVGILKERDRAQELARLGIAFGIALAALRTRPLLLELERRNAHRLAGRKAILGLGALAVHTQLAFADDALDVGEGEPREARLQEAVDAHAG